MSAIDKLTQRMRAYDGSFDGYPTTSAYDCALILGAQAASNSEDAIVMLAYYASDIQDDEDAYKRAMQFIADYVSNVVTCNMVEGENPFFEADPLIFEVS